MTGPDRQRAFEKGLCLGCGRSGHYISDCKEVKKTLKKFGIQQRKPSRESSQKYGKNRKSGIPGGKKFKKLATESEDKEEKEGEDKISEGEDASESEDSNASSEISETESEGGSENSDPESEG